MIMPFDANNTDAITTWITMRLDRLEAKLDHIEARLGPRHLEMEPWRMVWVATMIIFAVLVLVGAIYMGGSGG